MFFSFFDDLLGLEKFLSFFLSFSFFFSEHRLVEGRGKKVDITLPIRL